MALLSRSGGGRVVALWSAHAAVLAIFVIACDEEAPPKVPVTSVQAAADRATDFPWPPPLPSTSTEITKDLLAAPVQDSRLTVIADWLSRALRGAGYSDLRFYDIPKGFALVTPLELIDDQGLAMAHPDPKMRFSAAYPGEGFFTMRFWSDLLHAKVGRFRLFVFVVIDHPFGYAKDVTDAEILWKHPSSTLPLDRADLAYTAEDHCYALVYEVEHPKGTDRVTLVERPSDPALHLAKSGVLASLQRLSASSPAASAKP
jgi:hypothetical protein